MQGYLSRKQQPAFAGEQRQGVDQVLAHRQGPYSLLSNVYAIDINTTAFREYEIDTLAIWAPLRAIRTGPPEIPRSFREDRVVYSNLRIPDLTSTSRDHVHSPST